MSDEASYQAVKKSKLSFKNELGVKPKIKKQKKTTSLASSVATAVTSQSSSLTVDYSTLPDEGWLVCSEMRDIAGPVIILFQGDGDDSSGSSNEAPPLALTALPERGVMMTAASLAEGNASSASASPLARAEPAAVHQVFMARRLPVSAADPTAVVYSFKSANDKYLSCDQFGVITADKAAVSAREEFALVPRPDGFAVQSAAYGGFLKAQSAAVAASGGGSSALVATVRADSKDIGFRECFKIKCQAAAYKERKIAEQKARHKKDTSRQENAVDLEVEAIRRSQTWGMNRLVMPKESAADLRRAQQTGRLSETLLDRREKLKSDKYCK